MDENIRVNYFRMDANCLYCDSEETAVFRTTVKDGELRGIALLCLECGRRERDFAIEQGIYDFPKDTNWFQVHNKGDKN